MGSNSSCNNLKKFKDCIDVNEQDIKFIDVKKKFIRRKFIESNQVDHYFYKKILDSNINIETKNSNEKNALIIQEYTNGRINVYVYNNKDN